MLKTLVPFETRFVDEMTSLLNDQNSPHWNDKTMKYLNDQLMK